MAHYQDKNAPVKARVDDLLARMTLKEKVGQLNQRLYGWQAFERNGDDFALTAIFKDEVARFGGIGAVYGVFRADPWSKINAQNGIPRERSRHVTNQLQRYAIDNTRLGIPMLFSEEAPHGHMALGSESYPVNLARAASFNPDLHRAVAAATAEDIAEKGGHLALASALDLVRDPRWGRVEECFGEDPYLSGEMTYAITQGLQQQGKVAAVLKHFTAQGDAIGGHNSGPVNVGERELREIFLPVMQAAIRAGAKGVMAAYNEIDGVPCHCNHELLTGMLRQEMGFKGIVMADGCALDRLLRLDSDPAIAASMALTAGVDISLWDNIYPYLEEAVQQNYLDISVVDEAVSRLLTLKFELGLFEQRFDDDVMNPIPQRWRQLNLQAARESICMLKNAADLLPLSLNKKQTIAVIGPNADALYHQLGDYTAHQVVGHGTTILQGIQQLASPHITLSYAEGCQVRHSLPGGIEHAVTLAEKADYIVLVLGGSSARNFEMTFQGNGAVSSRGPNMDAGENVDVADLALPDCQMALFHALKLTQKPIIVLLNQGRPYAVPELSTEADALLSIFYPGAMGGLAVAETLFGLNNPSGKLPVSIPRASGQLPVYYNQKDVSYVENYYDLSGQALYPFGFGLSYSRFTYQSLAILPSELKVSDLVQGTSVTCQVTLTNTSPYAGAEVVQLYIHARQGSITRRKRELKAFTKVHLAPDETKTVTLTLDAQALSVWSAGRRYTIEPGIVDIYIGTGAETLLAGTLSLARG